MTAAALDHIIYVAILVCVIGLAILCMVGSIVYDFRRVRLNKKVQAHPNARALRARPLVSVVVSVGESTAGLEKCLLSIAQNRYRNCEVIVIGQNSSAVLRGQIKNFQRRHPSKKICLTKASAEDPVDNLAQKISGEFVFAISSNQAVDKHALHRCVRYFALNPQTRAIKANTRSWPSYTIRNLQKQFEESAANQWSKFKSLVAGQEGAIFRLDALLVPGTAHYCSDVIIHGKFNRSSKNYLKRFGYIFTFVLATYFIYIALFHQYPALIALAWASCIYLLDFGIWSDEHLSPSKKMRMFMLAPMASLLFYLMSLPKAFVKNI